MAAVERTFSREVEVESVNVVLKINQCEVGDVGCVVWDAGLVLAKYLDYLNMASNKEYPLLQGKNVIDIGSGTGLVGLVAACIGGNVTLTDLPELLPLLVLNIKENKHHFLGSVKADVLKWGETNSNFSQPDLLLVGDCIYYEKSLKPLVNTLSMLSNSNTEILLSYEERSFHNSNLLQTEFFDTIKETFVIENIPISEMHPDFHSSDIFILKIKKKEGEN
ncbi:protein N-lysine methyltransferase METTL21D-like [Centruroides vittatus]|uniref:protein N-lysine methyltransferase METTL21D-like n=1 Tax=Centruroides vittatus TaxID=120091 RepID=UPI0035104265